MNGPSKGQPVTDVNLETAISIAAIAHNGQVDKGGNPYILHPLRVMQCFQNTQHQTVAVLHDLVEDTDWTFEKLRVTGFSCTIVDALDALTKRKGEGYLEFIHRASQNPIAKKVKLADLLDNIDLGRIPNPTPEDYARVKKYDEAIKMILNW